MIADLLFYMFAAVLLGGALGVVAGRNPMHCVLFLILAFLNAAGLFILIGAEFLGLLLVMVYVGAIMVLFLFVLMTINIDFSVLKRGHTSYLPLGFLVGGVLLAQLVIAIGSGLFSGTVLPASLPIEPEKQNIVALGEVLFTNYVYPFIGAGMILLLAMVGAIVLTHRRREGVKRQDITRQVARTPAQSIRLTQPEIGKGVSDV